MVKPKRGRRRLLIEYSTGDEEVRLVIAETVGRLVNRPDVTIGLRPPDLPSEFADHLGDAVWNEGVRIDRERCVIVGCAAPRVHDERTCFDHTPDEFGVMPAECSCQVTDDGTTWVCDVHRAAYGEGG